ncbi:helix-turn-helix transcriptional regulator [Marinivivus vitaminiproducens]|uniref:helix-turn-helix transcriptional regulator n=1 Tax=Marinivivus vitaminiproducens TaxID=3035935 RepID=UPI00279B9044|nr:helix-turn-helix domain-containing protein [Geminicoccaceae bacterium SCSIO 64248]
MTPAEPRRASDYPSAPRFLRTQEAADYLGLSARTLEKHRTYGTGPVYRKLGCRVVYTIDELEAWAAIGTRRSTSDPSEGTGCILPSQSPRLIGRAA